METPINIAPPSSIPNSPPQSPPLHPCDQIEAPSTVSPLQQPINDEFGSQKKTVELRSIAKGFPNMMKFTATPAMLDHCILDSLMPSPRFMEKMTQDEGIITPPSSIKFADEALMQAGSPSPALSDSSSPKIAKTALQIGNPPSPQATTTHGEVNPGKSPLSHSVPKGAWASPLKIPTHLSSKAKTSDYSFRKPEMNPPVLSPNEHWPALSKQQPIRDKIPPTSKKWIAKSVDAVIPTDLNIIKASQEYPWAAKMRSICNLRRVTTPVFMEDGTPKVSIPSHVLLEGLENQKEFVIGQFYRCAAPAGGYIHGVLSRIWGRKCHISVRKLGESSYLFHVPDEATRKWVIQRGLWHVDDCLMFVSAWSPSPTISLPEISTIPVWLTLKNIPYQLYSIKGIDWIASGIGEPMLTSKPWLDPTQMGEAKILVEIKLNKQFPHKVAIEDESGTITMVDVVYSWLPSKCSSCGQLGHKSAYCLGLDIQSVTATGSALASRQKTTSASPLVQDVTVASCSVNATIPAGVINAEPPLGVVAVSTQAPVMSPEVPSVVSNEITTITLEPLSVTTNPNDASTSSSATVLTTTKTATALAKDSTTPSTLEQLPHLSDFETTPNAEVIMPAKETSEAIKTTLVPTAETIMTEVEVEIASASLENSIPPPLLDYEDPSLVSGNVSECRTDVNQEIVVENRFAFLDQGKQVYISEQEDESSSVRMTLRDRPIKPTTKSQDDWIEISGRRGRKGRGRGGRG